MSGVLVDHQLHFEAECCRMVEPFDKRHLNSNSINLTLGDTIRRRIPNRPVILGQDDSANWREPESPAHITIAEYGGDVTYGFHLMPGEMVLAHTAEVLRIPDTCCARVDGRSSVGRATLQVECAGFVESGFVGQITLEVVPLHATAPVIAPVGYPICQLVVMVNHEGERPSRTYGQIGRYQGQMGPVAARGPRSA